MQKKRSNNDVKNMVLATNSDAREILGEERSVGLKYLGKSSSGRSYMFCL